LYICRNDEPAEPVEGDENEQKEVHEPEPSMWEESFSGNTDSKPRGPESIGLDIDFPLTEYLYGIPEHADTFALKDTRYINGTLKKHSIYLVKVSKY
jgi:alpha 1,3-glucosidase